MININFIKFLSVFMIISSFGCGYSFQVSGSRELEKLGIQKIFVSKLSNKSFKPGIENIVYNDLLKTLSLHKKVILVGTALDADAILSGSVETAEYQSGRSVISGNSLTPSELSVPFDRISLSSVFLVLLDCKFNLQYRERPRSYKPLDSLVLWSSSFSRSKNFPASNQVGSLGTTTPLINESEFDRALGDLSLEMMEEVHEQMLARF